MTLKKKAIKSGLIILIFVPNVNSAPLTVGLIDTDRPPYFSKPTLSKPVRGMYIDILNEIGKQAHINFEYEFLPQARIRLYMKLNVIDVEPGIDKSWRTEEGEESSLYSDVLFESKEVIVYNPEYFLTPPSPSDLDSLVSCAIIGFSYLEVEPKKEYAKSKIVTEEQSIKLLELGRCDYAIMPIDVLKHMNTNSNLAMSSSVTSYKLRIRLNNEQDELVEPINNAIQSMKENGKLAYIINSYLGAQ
jgi:ABC-type amino acid transport substrate-binding protein